MLRIGILGCGRIGQVHAQSIASLPNAKTVAVSDAVPAAAVALGKAYDARVLSSAELIASDDVDAVIIGTPTTTHFDLIHAAAAAGKAIFCEKPVDLSTDRIRECLKILEKHDVPFMVGFNRRFDPNFAGLAARLHAGEIGDVEMITILSRDPGPPPIGYIKTSGGLFRDMMIHDLDMARFLLGEEPVEVHAVGSALVDPEIGEAGDVDTAAVLLRTKSGRICQISNSRRATYGYDQRLEVHGSKGMLRVENVLENQIEVANAAGYARAPTQNFFLERYSAAYRIELAQFVQSVLDKTPMNPDAEDGLKAQILADAATVACQTGQPQRI